MFILISFFFLFSFFWIFRFFDALFSYHDYKKALTRNIVLLDLMNPFSIHSILEDATSGDPNRVSQVPGECAKACAIPSAVRINFFVKFF
jgi:hypothetical protein